MNSVLHAPIPFVAAALGFLVLMPVASAARRAPPPVAVLDAPATVAFGLGFTVSGVRSVDIGGSIVRYQWTLDGGPAFETADPDFTFAIDPANPLALGSHTVRLVVVDDAGNVSAPDTATVRVVDRGAPTAVLDAPATVPFGQDITVSGARSVDVGGRVIQYRWRLDGGAAVVTADAAFTFVVDPASPLGLGSHAIELVVVDDSGNMSAPVFRKVTVRYVVTGYFAPVRNLPIVNVASAGRMISVRWQLSDAAGNPVSSLGSFRSLMSGPIACNASPGDVPEEQMAAADGGPLRYDPDAGHFEFNWRTSREWAGCRLLRLTLANGSRTYAMFRLR